MSLIIAFNVFLHLTLPQGLTVNASRLRYWSHSQFSQAFVVQDHVKDQEYELLSVGDVEMTPMSVPGVLSMTISSSAVYLEEPKDVVMANADIRKDRISVNDAFTGPSEDDGDGMETESQNKSFDVSCVLAWLVPAAYWYG
ncbi:hypothetical protein HETIRDRAFT_108692 [Heterobasidion irregulare TC 32-1]|uniref:Uncharacterized protein n=1 Tax=Heterobasidion irregulare (strain TC 32-1) TaxID=747525 RepID=W4K9H2_HETIT|nr:uncharacterized protein HETIRDRAFT_108692 [Heterobasidion irregulare TC 32-1]ETW82384.1 hypothetical protein HETIRDRAFT_108692 [Heterobasidion irregulare TC 32-1]